MKKNYSKPIALVETFTPNHFVAACDEKWDYKIKSLGATCWAVYDDGQDGRWGSYEGSHGNQKSVDPHGEYLYFTEGAISDVLEYRKKAFYNMGDQAALNAAKENNSMGYVIHIAEAAMNGATNPNTPVPAGSVGLWGGSGGGHGVFVFDMEQQIIKNQS